MTEPPYCWPPAEPHGKLLLWGQRRVLVMMFIIRKMRTSNDDNSYRESVPKPTFYSVLGFYVMYYQHPPHKVHLPMCIPQMSKVRPKELRQCAQCHSADAEPASGPRPVCLCF